MQGLRASEQQLLLSHPTPDAPIFVSVPTSLLLLLSTSRHLTQHRDVLASSSSRGLELLGCLQDSLTDPHPAVAALALEGLDTLLKEDDLDFYKTWPLVARLLNPKRMLAAVGVQEGPLSPADLKGPPPHPQSQQDGSSTHQQQQQQRQWHKLGGAAAAATGLQHSSAGWCVARWVGCLRHGVLDAGSQPEMAAGVVQLLWLATGANEAQVGSWVSEWGLAHASNTMEGFGVVAAAGSRVLQLAAVLVVKLLGRASAWLWCVVLKACVFGSHTRID